MSSQFARLAWRHLVLQADNSEPTNGRETSVTKGPLKKLISGLVVSAMDLKLGGEGSVPTNNLNLSECVSQNKQNRSKGWMKQSYGCGCTVVNKFD